MVATGKPSSPNKRYTMALNANSRNSLLKNLFNTSINEEQEEHENDSGPGSKAGSVRQSRQSKRGGPSAEMMEKMDNFVTKDQLAKLEDFFVSKEELTLVLETFKEENNEFLLQEAEKQIIDLIEPQL
jgi:hypothetical protein